ncbi:MAG: hypothetical protein HC898_01890 [Phycisphaerales bacterium]|nr:hypothetical protein [Phycisphaerales bacterium]
MIEDYRRGDVAEHQGVKHKRISGAGDWHALRRSRADQHLTRAVRFDETDRRLVELALPWPHGPQSDLELELLQSFRLEAPNQQGLRWCAWGMRVQVPQGWKLHSAGIEPGSAHMRFTQGRAESLVRRLGAIDTWFHGHLDEFLTQQVSDSSISPRVTEVNKHPACEMETIEPGTRWQRWTGRLRARHDLAWLCPSDHAVYHVMTLAAPSQSQRRCAGFCSDLLPAPPTLLNKCDSQETSLIEIGKHDRQTSYKPVLAAHQGTCRNAGA